MTSGIYKLTFKKTKEIYVGSSVNIERRFMEHAHGVRAYALNPSDINSRCSRLSITSTLLSCDPWDLAAVKAEFECQVLEVVDDRALLIQRERYWYDLLRPTLNKTRPSECYTRHSQAM